MGPYLHSPAAPRGSCSLPEIGASCEQQPAIAQLSCVFRCPVAGLFRPRALGVKTQVFGVQEARCSAKRWVQVPRCGL